MGGVAVMDPLTDAERAVAIIALATPEVTGALLAAAIDRAVEHGRDAWRATSAAFDDDLSALDEALVWLNDIADGETI